MKKILLTGIIVLTVCTSFSQTGNQAALDSVSKVVIHYLQTKQTDSIYALAGERFKSQITAENFKSISENQVYPLTDFKNVTYVSNANGINKYKIDGAPKLQLLISLDKNNKLETFLIQPFSGN